MARGGIVKHKKRDAEKKGEGKKPPEAAPPLNTPFTALKELRAQMEKEAKEAKEAKASSSPGAKRPVSPSPGPAYRPPPPARSALSSASADDDALSFHRMMSGVTPLDRKAVRIPRSQQALEPSASAEMAARRHADARTAEQREAEEVHAHLRALVEGAVRFEVEDDGRHVEGRRVDLPAETVRRLRRGVVPIDARLDLHGLGVGDARTALESFLREKRARGEKCVLVVHGKGEHSPRGAGVLRGEISAWLSQGPASEHVAAFATAMADDGGEGAVYVLLRR
jgi:DNA-nicking Smr family endonuclease